MKQRTATTRPLSVEDALLLVKGEGITIVRSEVTSGEITYVSSPFPGAGGCVSFAGAKHTAAEHFLSQSSLVFLPPEMDEALLEKFPNHAIVARPRLAYALVAQEVKHRSLRLSHPHPSFGWGEKLSLSIHESAIIGRGVVFHGKVTVGAQSIIGDNAVIGGNGFGYERDRHGLPVHLPHIGDVEIAERVTIGSHCTVHRGTFGTTKIGADSKLDSHVQISHNADVGQGVLVASGAQIAGSVSVGDYSWVGTNAVVSNGVHLGQRSWVAIGAIVLKDVQDDWRVFGNPARRY